jgi:AraC family transcriptional regulator of arabinose operon
MLREPLDYYNGFSQPDRIRCQNIILFERRERKALQQLQLANRMHHRYVLMRVLETAGVVSVDGQSFRLDVGDVLLVQPYQFHYYKDLASDRLRWLFVTFELEQGASLLEKLAYRRMRMDAVAAKCWESLVRLWTRSSANQKALLLPSLDLILTQLCVLITDHMHGSDTMCLPPSDEWIIEIESLIIRSVKEHWTLAQVAKKAGFSERHLRARFEQKMGLSMREFRQNYQFHIALSLMRDAACSLSAVADLSGFNSQSVFTRFIRRMSGRTPRELSQEIRQGRYQA